MVLVAGAHPGPYEILAPIGVGEGVNYGRAISQFE